MVKFAMRDPVYEENVLGHLEYLHLFRLAVSGLDLLPQSPIM